MAQDRTRLIVRKTLEQVKAELGGATGVDNHLAVQTLDAFEKRLDFNLDLAGIGKIAGRKPKGKKVKPKPETDWRPAPAPEDVPAKAELKDIPF